MLMSLVVASLLGGLGDDYPALKTAEAEKQRQLEEQRRVAHDALDEGYYERAVECAKRAKQLESEIAALQDKARACLKAWVFELVSKLDNDEFDVREQASTKLRELGSAAVPTLLKLRRLAESPEMRYRIDECLKGVSVDADGKVRQWAVEATASTEYTYSDWSAKQMTGAPDTPHGGDARTAWAAREADAGTEWVRLKYVLPVKISKVRIHETYVPGGVVAVDVIASDGTRTRAWEGVDPGGPAPVWFEVDLGGVVGREVVIVLDTKKNPGWEEIDAVELVGDAVEE